ncbi:MAG: hypothetical protein DCF30_19985, partial [Hyphomicrobiales bacterium]
MQMPGRDKTRLAETRGDRMRILVFRPPVEAERTAAAIRARGHEAIVAPLFAVSRLPAPAPQGPFSAIVLTSANAVPALADLPQAWRDLPVFAVGGRTAARVREAGFEDARSANGNRDDLIGLIRDNLAAPAGLLMIVARDRHEDVDTRLTDAGFEVAIWEAYEAQAVSVLPADAQQALRQGGVDGALHYSARGVRTCLALARDAGLAEALLDLTHVTLSADVAGPLISAGASTVLVAEYPEEAALLAALDQVSARNRLVGDVTQGAVAPDGVETDKDAMTESETPNGTPDAKATSNGEAESGNRSKTRTGSRSGRTPPTIDVKAQDVTQDTATHEGATSAVAEAAPAAEEGPAPAPGAEVPPGAVVSPEAVLPTEALPQEFAGGASAGPVQDNPAAPAPSPPAEPARSRLPALALAGLVGGIVGAGLVMLATSRMTPAVTPEQIAQLQSRLDSLQTAATTLDRKASAASETATKAGAAAQAATARTEELARAQAPDASAIAGLNAQAQRAEAAASAIGQRLEQNAARIGTVETLAKAAAAPSPQALAAARIVLAERVQTAIASGQPFARDVAALAKGGARPNSLRRSMPSRRQARR